MTAVNDFNRSLIEEFRANDGKVEGAFDGRAAAAAHHDRREERAPRTRRRSCTCSDGDRVVVFGSKAGAPTHPAWYHNLVANPTVTVELPGERSRPAPVVAEGDERERLFGAAEGGDARLRRLRGKTDRARSP